MIKSLTILGGGTAGFIFALMQKSAFPELDITVIASKQLGIIGVGEGSTEHFENFLRYCDIHTSRIIKETGATYKTGIRFINWNGEGTEYWHSLADDISTYDQRLGVHPNMLLAITDNHAPLDTVYPFNLTSEHTYPEYGMVHQFHFDTNKLNIFFHKIAEERGIKVVDDIINQVDLDEQGNVASLVGSTGTKYISDFYADASGFNRVISSKLGVKWIDCKDQLPMNSAIAFPTGYKKDIPSHTIARACSSGWMWRIPTQDRFGNGYVFCDDFITEEGAIKEAQQYIDEPINVGKKIKFSAGYVDKFWHKNCVSIGLSGMFVEPLEATSIGCTIQQAFCFSTAVVNYTKNTTQSEKVFNIETSIVASNIIDFVQLHYFTKRNDSEFWKWAKHNIKKTPFVEEYLEDFKSNGVNLLAFNGYFSMFKSLNWMQVMHGLDLFDSKNIKNNLSNAKLYSILHNTKTVNVDLMEKSLRLPHREILEYVKTLSI
tara:strand:- start:27172 stop:28635 length:1464 start_codon:yes stop_codon:yes gene_type:complete